MGQGQQRLTTATTPRVAEARGRSVSGHGHDVVAHVFDGLRGGQARPGPDGHGGRPAARPPGCSPTTSASPPRSAASTNGSSSTSSRTSRRSSRRCWTCGSAAATSCAWSVTRPRRSTPSPAPTPTSCATSRPSSPAPPRSSWSATTARRPRWSRPPTRCLPAPRARASTCAPSSPLAPRSTYAARPDEVAEAEAVAARIGELRAAGRDARRDRRPVPHQRPVRGVRGGALRPRHPLRRSRRRPVLRPPRGPRGGHPAPRRGAVRRGRRACSRPSAPPSPGMGWTPEAPVRARPDPRPLGVLAGADRPGDRVRRPPAPASTRSSTTSTGAPPSSTPRSPTASPWRPSTPPRGWSGTRSSSAACRTAPCRSPTPRRPAAVEEERRLLYVGMTRARRRPGALVGAGPQARRPGRPQAVPLPRRRCCPRRRSPVPKPAEAEGRADVPRVRQAAPDGGRQGAPPVRRLPGALRRGAVRAAARVAHRARPRGGDRRRSWSSATPRSSRSPSTSPADVARRCSRSAGSAARSSRSTATTLLDLVG